MIERNVASAKIWAKHYLGPQIQFIRLLFTVAIIAIGPLICGISLGFSSSVSAQLLIGDTLIAFFSSVINLGALAGCLVVSPVLNTLGRRMAHRISAVPSILGWFLIATAQGLSPPATDLSPSLIFRLIFGRVLTGLAAGMMTTVGSVYLVEVAPPSQSGRIGSLAQLAVVAGTCIAYYRGMTSAWYETARLMVFISIVLLISSFYLPESPVWLARMNQPQKAQRSLSLLRGEHRPANQKLVEKPPNPNDGKNLSPPPFDKTVLSELLSSAEVGIASTTTATTTTTSRLIGLILPCTTIPPELTSNLRIAMLLVVAQQTTGINVITFYTEPLCQRMVHVADSARCAFSLGLGQLVFSLIATILIDRFPRRLLVVAMGGLMAISMFFFAIGQQFPTSAPVPPIAALTFFLFGYQCGWGPLAMLITLELFPASVRGAAGGATVAVSWLVTFLVTQSFQTLVNLLGREIFVFSLFCLLTALASVYFYRRLPETNTAFTDSPSLIPAMPRV
uniref:MFS domain-containing protein n=1 Tax=Mesocestoides corti TaxID=53468 RepID=A0A5K3F213_MESCO